MTYKEKILVPGIVTGYIVETPVSLSFASTTNTDASLGSQFTFTATSDFTLANPTNSINGQNITWEIIQDSSGNHVMTLGNNFVFGTDITSVVLSTAANATDFLMAKYNSTAGKWRVLAFIRGF